MEKYLLGIDNGGTFSKDAIFDINGNQIALASKQTEVITPIPGYTERDMKKLWVANLECIREVILKSKIDSKKKVITSLGSTWKYFDN